MILRVKSGVEDGMLGAYCSPIVYDDGTIGHVTIDTRQPIHDTWRVNKIFTVARHRERYQRLMWHLMCQCQMLCAIQTISWCRMTMLPSPMTSKYCTTESSFWETNSCWLASEPGKSVIQGKIMFMILSLIVIPDQVWLEIIIKTERFSVSWYWRWIDCLLTRVWFCDDQSRVSW